MARRSGRKSLPVLTYLVLIFGVSVVALGGLVVTTTMASFNSERHRVVSSLRAGAELAAATLSDDDGQTMAFLGPFAAQPAVRALDAARCDVAFAGLGSLIGAFGHLHLLGPAGEEICSLVPPTDGPRRSGVDWVALLPGDGPTSTNEPIADPLTGKLSQVLVVLVQGDGGRTGHIVAVLYLSELGWGIDVPANFPADAAVVELDASRTVVVRASDNARDLGGRATAGTGLSGRGPGRGRTIKWFDGKDRFAVEVAVPDSDRRLVVAVPAGALTAGAEEQLLRNLVLGVVASFLLAGLGLLLHRRLARPIRRITSAIRAAGRGREDMWAPVEGPAELGDARRGGAPSRAAPRRHPGVLPRGPHFRRTGPGAPSHAVEDLAAPDGGVRHAPRRHRRAVRRCRVRPSDYARAIATRRSWRSRLDAPPIALAV